MSGKSDKCCCDHCTGQCVSIGTLYLQCSVCQQSPLYWLIKDFESISPTYFTCCTNLTNPPIFGTVRGNPGGSQCIWNGDVITCADRTTATWHLAMNGQAPGQVLLYVQWSDGRYVEYANTKPWNCLCPNSMTRTYVSDVGNVDACNPKTTLCLIPIPPCCNGRAIPLPLTLTVQITIVAGSCPCFPAGTTSFPIVWNPADYKWEGQGTMGGCDIVKVKIGCSVLDTYSDITDWNGTVQFGSDLPMDISQNIQPDVQCDPVHVPLLYQFTGGICGPLAVYEVAIDIVEM